MKYSIELYEIKQRQKTGYSYSALRGYSYLSTFAQTFLACSYYFQPDEVETFNETTKNKYQHTGLCFSSWGLSNTIIKINITGCTIFIAE